MDIKEENIALALRIAQNTIGYELESVDTEGNWYHSLANGGEKMTEDEIKERVKYIAAMAKKVAQEEINVVKDGNTNS